MQVNSWNAYNNSSEGARQFCLPMVDAAKTGTNQSLQQKAKSYMPDWNKVKEAVIEKLPQTQEFAKRALAGAVGAGASMSSMTVVNLALGCPTMSASQVVGFAATSGIVSACTASVPSEAFVHGIGVGVATQLAFSYATNIEKIEGQKTLAKNQKEWQGKLDDLQKEHDLDLMGTECKTGFYKTRFTTTDVYPECTFDPNNNVTKLFTQQQFAEMYNEGGVLVNCNEYAESDYANYCNYGVCEGEYKQVVANGNLEKCESLGFTYNKVSLEEQCKQRGFVEPWGGLKV